MAVGAELIRLEVEGAGNVKGDAPPAAPGDSRWRLRPSPAPSERQRQHAPVARVRDAAVKAEPALRRHRTQPPAATRAAGDKPIASPAVRRRAWELGIELQYVHGSGPAGRIMHEDLDVYLASRGQPAPQAGGGAYAAAARGRSRPRHRPAPQDRAEDAGGQAPHPALHATSRRSTSPSWKRCARKLNAQVRAPSAASSRCCRCWRAPWCWRCATSRR